MMNRMEKSKLIDKIVPEVVSIRREIHMHPELSLEEHRTSELICDYLRKVGVEYTTVADTGVVGTLLIDESYPTIAIRAEMDALPIQEQSQCDYASQNQGVMHACGHDGVVAIALGLANIISNSRDRLKCNLRFLFQPAEEAGSGAKAMIKEGVLKNPTVDRIMVYHLNSRLPMKLVLVRGNATAAVGTLRIKILGKSGHWSQRERSVNAISVAARIIAAIEEFNKTYEPGTPFVVGVGTIAGGTKASIIADHVEMKCTLRTANGTEQSRILNVFRERLERVALECEAAVAIEFQPGSPPVHNDPLLLELAESVGEEIFGKENVVVEDTVPLAGDDAGFFFEEIPGLKLSFCAGFSDKENHPLHNPLFDFDEQIMPLALRTLYSLITKMHSAIAT